MTLRTALEALHATGRFDAEPGPVRHAWGYVSELMRSRSSHAPDLDSEVEAQSPMLVGALLCLLRHLTDRPGDPVTAVTIRDKAGNWFVPSARGLLGEGLTELDAVVAALVAEAER